MRTLLSRSRSWILIFGIVCLALAISPLALGQYQPPQQHQPLAGTPMENSGSWGSWGPGMRPGPGMQETGGAGLPPGAPAMGPREGLAELLQPIIQKELAITTDQQQKLNDMQFNSEKEKIQHRAALQVLHMELAHMADSETPDRAAIDKKIQESAQEEAAAMRALISTRLNALAVLTAAQRSRLAQLMQNRKNEDMLRAGGNRSSNPRAPIPATPGQPQ